MSFRTQAEHFLYHDLWTTDPSALAFWPRLRIRCLRLVVVVLEEFRTGILNLQAMSLVYRSLLSFVPLLAVTFSGLKAFGAHQQLEPFLAQVLAPLGPQREEITQYVIAFVNNLRVGVLGALGVAGLFFTVISLIGQLEDALNYIWRVRYSRTLTRKFSDYLSVVLVGPILIFTAFALTASAQSHWVVQRLLQSHLGFVVTLVTRVMPLIFLCTVFTFLYQFLPNTQVRFRSALLAGVITGLLWQAAGMGFAAFVANSTSYTAIYSSFAILLLFLIWLYVGWLIVLIGGEVAYLHQHAISSTLWLPRRASSRLFRARLALLALTAITRRYLAHEPPWRLMELAAALNVSSVQLEDLIDELVQHRILLRSAQPEGFALACPPEQVSVSEILEVMDDLGSVGAATAAEREDAISRILRRRNQATRQALAGLTLRSLTAEPHCLVLPESS